MTIQSENILIGLADILKAHYFVNNKLHVCSRDTKENDSWRTLWGHCCQEAGLDNKRLRELNNSTCHVSKLQYYCLKIFHKYKEIKSDNKI